MVEQKDMNKFSSLRVPKLHLTTEQPSLENVRSDQKNDIPFPRAKENPQQDSRMGEIGFTKPHTHQRRSEGSNIPCVHQDPETPQKLRQNCVWVSPEDVLVSSGLLQGQGLWV